MDKKNVSEKKHRIINNKDLKIIIVGDSGTGKTSFINRYILDQFEATYQVTIASQLSSKLLKIDDITYRLQFWDIAGQDRSPETTKYFTKDTKGIIICFEVNNNKTKENTLKWKNSLEQNLDLKNIPIIIVENKCDLLGETEEDYNKNIEELNKFCEDNNMQKCFRTSAKNGYGVEESINYLVREIVKMNNFNDVFLEEESLRETIALSKTPHYSIRAKKDNCC